MFNGFSIKAIKPLASKTLAPPADELEIDPGVVELLKRPKAINPEDDMFNDQVLSGKWTSLSGSYNLSEMPGWLALTGRIAQPVPAGDWSIETEMMTQTQTAAGYVLAGFLLADSGTLTGSEGAYYFGKNNSVTAELLQFNKYTNYVYGSTPTQILNCTTMRDSIFLRIVKVGTTYNFEYSGNGKRWTRWGSNSSIGFTPTYFGLHPDGGATKAWFNYFIRR